MSNEHNPMKAIKDIYAVCMFNTPRTQGATKRRVIRKGAEIEITSEGDCFVTVREIKPRARRVEISRQEFNASVAV